MRPEIINGHLSNFKKQNLDNGLAALKGQSNLGLSSFAHLWSNLSKTTIPISTHQFLAGNHRLMSMS